MKDNEDGSHAVSFATNFAGFYRVDVTLDSVRPMHPSTSSPPRSPRSPRALQPYEAPRRERATLSALCGAGARR